MTDYWELYELPIGTDGTERHIGTYASRRMAEKKKRKTAKALDLRYADYEIRRVIYE